MEGSEVSQFWDTACFCSPWFTPSRMKERFWGLEINTLQIKSLGKVSTGQIDFTEENLFYPILTFKILKHFNSSLSWEYDKWVDLKPCQKTSLHQRKQAEQEGSLWNKRIYLQIILSDKGSLPRKYKELLRVNDNKKNWLKNAQRTWIDISVKKIYKWPTSTWKVAQCQ